VGVTGVGDAPGVAGGIGVGLAVGVEAGSSCAGQGLVALGFPGGPVWTWLRSPQPQPGRSSPGVAVAGAVTGAVSLAVAAVDVAAAVAVTVAVGVAVGVAVAVAVAAVVGIAVAVGWSGPGWASAEPAPTTSASAARPARS
jgi:hypothetical protein